MSNAKECDNYKDGNCKGGSSSEECNKCCCNCETPCSARCGCTKNYFDKEI